MQASMHSGNDMLQLSLFPHQSEKKSALAQTIDNFHIYTICFSSDLATDFRIHCETESQWCKAIDTFGITDVEDKRLPIE